MVLRELATLQKQGHKATLIIGDFTASIGDPTGKSKTRIPLSTSQINKNIKQLLPQIFTILDSNHTTIEFNKSWLSKITLSEMLITLSKITVSQALGRNDFQNRLENNQPVGMHEIIYPICQALDSVHIKADLELGGEDQLFNVMMGRDLMKQLEMKPQLPLLFPLLLGTDGINKMSQSLGNFISIRETPENMFGKIMSIPDSIMENWTNLLTDLDFETIAQENPRDTKLILAENIVSALHSTEKAKEAKENFVNRFSNGIISKEIEKIKISEANNWLELVNK